MNNLKPLVSIIVPVYNTENDLLTRCVNALIGQTYENCEFIIVDDGSKPETANFLDSLKSDSRFIVVHQENGGASVARNTGLTYVKGKYFSFFDADDYCSNDIIEKLVDAAETNNSDLCIAEFIFVSDTTDKEIARSTNKYECTIDVDDHNRIALMQQTFHYVSSTVSLISEPHMCTTKELWLQGKVWGKLYKTDLYKNEKFVKGIPVSQDAVYTIDILKKCKRVSFVKDTFYYYYINQGSLTSNNKDMKGLDIQFTAMKQKLNEYPEIFEGMYSLLVFGAVKSVVSGFGFWKSYKMIKSFFLLPEMIQINTNLSLEGVAHSQEKRTRICLKNNWILLLILVSKLSLIKERIRNKKCK